MQKFRYISIAFFIGVCSIIYSCKKHKHWCDVCGLYNPSGALTLQLQSEINGNKIVLNSVKYLNANLDTFTVSKLKYYISNIRLQKADSSYYDIPESYYLIDVSVNNDTSITIPSIPLGNYIGAKISIGVDSIHNHTGAQPGALDPTIAGEMFWTWLAGYKFVLFEGTYKTASSGGFQPLLFHISDDVNYRSAAFNSGTANWTDINIRDAKTTKMQVKVNFEEMFKSPNTISFDVTNNVAGGPASNQLADNYADIFGLASIVNE
jgi:hypothetical protein